MKNLEGKIAIVTGGAKGLGKAMAKRLLEEGVTVVIADILEDEMKNTVEEFKSQGYEADYFLVNLESVQQISNMMDYVVKKYGTLDILVNNAGIQIRKWAVDFEEAEWDKLMGINLKALYFASTAAAKVMIPKGKGVIVCISSANSTEYTSKRSLYNISKAAVNGLVGTLGVEWARFGIRINAVAPGYVATDMVKQGITEGIINIDEILTIVPGKRLLETEEIANAVCFLASDDSSGMVGQTLFVDGGWSKNGLPEKKDL
ncbi:SDR family oxidoreductase [Petroclostridium sp. X23]|uniref:SDR family NAD(P)-dependent oxidoreductase n=1 Tax=Petroclostridium sp. X23 TaxID=3045146 RepID=UPI0024AE2495|nr:SDR family oxidoreductase [Petroclostridium sp. X23]WHH59369.1 SDR family oxidoreductase [Petroclostridium sp. X23]